MSKYTITSAAAEGFKLGEKVTAEAANKIIQRQNKVIKIYGEFLVSLSDWSYSGDEARMCAIEVLQEVNKMMKEES